MIKQILEQIDWPPEVLILDFETYFSKNYTFDGISIIEYIKDPRFEFTGLGVQILNHKLEKHGSVFFQGPEVPWAIERLQKHFGKALHNCTVVAKNNQFDVTILAEKFGIYPPFTIDIEDLSRYYDSRMSQKLKDLAKTFKLPPKGDTMQFKGLRWRDMSPEQRIAMKEYCLGDIYNETELLKILLPVLDNPGTELNLARHTLNLYLKPVLSLDTHQAIQIATDMEKALLDDLERVAWVSEYATKKKKTIPEIMRAKKLFPVILQDCLDAATIEGENTVAEQVPMKQGKNKMIPATAKEDVAFQLLLVHKNKKVRDLCKAKAACTSWPLHQSKVNRMINQAKVDDGLLRMPIKYYGAHTGRWSGTGGWNPFNLGGKGRGKPIHPLISQVRGTIVAPNGYTLVLVDSEQIEARELAWVAHQEDLIEGFRNGEDIYSEFASELFQAKVWKPSEEEKKTPEGKTADIRRGFGKDAILGCGYGMGANTFFDRCRQNSNLRPLFDSGEYTWDFIDRLIKTYRIKYANISSFWTEIEKCFRWPTKYPNEKTEYAISDKAKIRFWRSGSTTQMQLPSGRVMNYRHAVVDRKDQIKYKWGHLWGGSITENLIQAMCRCLLGGWLLECEENGIKIVTHTYDELVACVPKDEAEEALTRMQVIMSRGPEWADGLPLATEGKISRRYCK